MPAMKRIYSFLFLVAAASCIDPYTPNIRGYKSLLVVEGLITDENISHRIKLSRTTGTENSDPEKITDANVFISDDDGIKAHLQNFGDGIYKTDSTSFTGIVGKRYTLQILTSDGKEYKSEECTMIPVAGIDSLYYVKGEEISGNLGEYLTGIRILLNSTDATGKNQYFRWTYDETWRFNIPYTQQYIYHYIKDTTYFFESMAVPNTICWKKNRSGEILTSSILSGAGKNISRQLIQFIPPAKSDRLTIQYSIMVRQYSVSEKEFDFWNNLRKVSESGGDIFDSQPYPVISNIHNVNNAGEMVPGYFEVSAVSQKRIFITSQELEKLNLPYYKTDCVEIAKSPDDWPVGSRVSWNEIYQMFMETGDFTFIGPDVKPGTVLPGTVYQSRLLELLFSPNVCSVCEKSGFTQKPDFWIDLE
jgi:hypothetical protein